MKITAVLAVRNEEVYLTNCLRHLVRNNVNFFIIDHESSDASSEIYRRDEFAANLVAVEEFAFTGVFSLADQLRRKMKVIENLETDWVIHLDADEVMHSYRPGETLNQALSRLDAQGFNAVDFDEFVFLPVEQDYQPDALEQQPMLHYYFFQPFAPRLMRAWKQSSGFSIAEHAGHVLSGSDVRLADEHLALRHYMVRSQEHALVKYTKRVFDTDELSRGWHQARANQHTESFRFPPATALRKLPFASDRNLDRSEPWKVHYWRRGRV